MLKKSFSEGFSGTFAMNTSDPLLDWDQIFIKILSLRMGSMIGCVNLQLKVGDKLLSMDGVEEVSPNVRTETNALQSDDFPAGGNPSHLKMFTVKLYPDLVINGLLSMKIPFFYS